MSNKSAAYELLQIIMLEKNMQLGEDEQLPEGEVVKKCWSKVENKYEPQKAESIIKKAAALCGGEGILKQALKDFAKTKSTKKKRTRGVQSHYQITHDRTKKRHMVRARFDGEPWFAVGDWVEVKMSIVDNEPAIVLKKVNKEEGDKS